MNLHLLPRPRKIEIGPSSLRRPIEPLGITDEWHPLSTVIFQHKPRIAAASKGTEHIIVRHGDDPTDESYRLNILPDPNGNASYRIECPGRLGVRWALLTLRQIFEQAPLKHPDLLVADAPAFANRGVMLDVSRDRVPRQEELLKIVDILATLKYNHLQLYTEHTFAYAGHETVWKDASPITPQEIRELDDYCRTNGITLAANQNCFGHMARWLKHPRYASLAETHGNWYWNGKQFPGPFSLCPGDPGSLDLIKDLLSQLLPNFSSKIINIGCDEALDVGQGRSKDAVAKRGAEVYFDFVRKVSDEVARAGFKPQFWADIALSHPESLNMIPEEMTALAWGYEPDAPFEEWVKRLKDVGREVWVCPGTSSWRSITGRTTERRGNLAAAGKAAEYGATGFLVTDWGDDGHRQQWPISLVGLAEAAEFAWNGRSGVVDGMAVSSLIFHDPTGFTATWLERLGDADLPQRSIYGKPLPDGMPSPLRNASALFVELHRNVVDNPVLRTLDLWKATASILEDLERTLPRIADLWLRDELKHTLRVAKIATQKVVLRQGRSLNRPSSLKLADELRGVIAEHRRLWLMRSRSGGLDDSCRHYQNIIVDILQ